MTMPDELRDLLWRFTKLGTMLPDPHAMPADRSETELILREMRQVKAEIDMFLVGARH
jgi:hypothetical protein